MLLGVYSILNPKRTYAAFKHIDLAFTDSLSKKEKQKILSLSLLNFMRFPFEWIRSFFWSNEEYRNIVHLSDSSHAHLQEAMAHDKGVLLLTAHHGHWEIGSRMFDILYPGQFASVAKPLSPKLLNDWIHSRRRMRGGAEVIYKQGALRAVMRALNNKKIVGILMDQNRPDGVFAPFFGHPAKTSPMIASLALKMGAPVLPATCLRKERGYEVVALKPLFFEPQKPSQDNLIEVTGLLNQQIETLIHLAPEQYLWTHLRYRSTADGTPSLYDS